MNIEFCDCGGILVGSNGGLQCRSCGKMSKKSTLDVKMTERSSKKDIIVVDDNAPDLPTMQKSCQKCGNERAYWWLIQTRSADEPPTQFFKCTNEKCNHTWREYK